MTEQVKKRAELVSAGELPTLLRKAIQTASRRVELEDPAGDLVVKWDLIGRIVRDEGRAFEFAESVVREVGRQGIKAEPAVLNINKKIIAGFFERGAVPQIRRL